MSGDLEIHLVVVQSVDTVSAEGDEGTIGADVLEGDGGSPAMEIGVQGGDFSQGGDFILGEESEGAPGDDFSQCSEGRDPPEVHFMEV